MCFRVSCKTVNVISSARQWNHSCVHSTDEICLNYCCVNVLCVAEIFGSVSLAVFFAVLACKFQAVLIWILGKDSVLYQFVLQELSVQYFIVSTTTTTTLLPSSRRQTYQKHSCAQLRVSLYTGLHLVNSSDSILIRIR